jgi:hypothetical protein
MKQKEQTRARRLLRMREEGAKFKWSYLVKSKIWIPIIIIGIIVPYCMQSDSIELDRAAFLVLGILIGRILRDMIWIKDIVDGFPFMEKVLNWDKVKEIAEEQ